MMRRRNLRVTEQLLGELEAKRYDSALTRRILEAPNAFPRLLRACFLGQDQQLASARADVEAALAHAGDNPVVGLVAGMVSFVTRDYQRALDILDAVARTHAGPLATRARQQYVHIATGLGWDHDARAAIEAAIEATPGDPSWRGQAVRLFSRARDWQRALDHAEAALEQLPDNPRLWMEAAGAYAHLGRTEPARAALERTLALVPAGDEAELGFLREAVRVAIDAGAFDLAEATLARARGLDPEAADLGVRAAELHAWRDDEAAAAAVIAEVLERAPEFGPALRMRGAASVRAGRYTEAVAELERALAHAPTDYQAHLWLAEALLRLERYPEAHAALHHGTAHADGFVFVAWLLRFLVVAAEQPEAEAEVPVNRTEEFELALRELCPELAERALTSRRSDDFVAAVEAALAGLRGNRSAYPTQRVDGRLTRLRTRTGCRHASRRALQLIRVASADECLAAFDEIVAAYPGSSLPLCHRGELRLWLGDEAGARADLEAAIASVEGTRWAYMGLSTLDLLADDPQACLDRNAHGVAVMQNSEGPAIHVFRGEAKRKLGRLDDAIVELEASVERHPARVGATVNLALAYHAAGREDEFESVWRRLADEQASGLISDAAAELGVQVFGDPDQRPDAATRVAVLERALVRMGGNRSSSLPCYRTASGRLRFVPVWPNPSGGPHARDHQHLEQAKRILLKALTHYTGPRPR